ncbi:serine/threonine protein kinase [Paenibacillus flagellatus]|uniref:Protein kinase domain-containing protein n=1 Tax=Paenibacillus flagellatus TaxID=2211139 RepID=A0A2V5K8Q7_9BACL|nr:serine/threonine-protein kinase [Paenibacillus flagellatus]PYI55881.1 hypothetical protein DLM86_09215 [Paenibacillus flagellatus]
MNQFDQSRGPIGTVVGGRYRIAKAIGEGGMGTVFLADDLKLPGKRWAVKRTRPFGASGMTAEHEAAVLMKLDHPYLPHVVDYFPPDENGFSHLVMEYVNGVTLQQLFERSGRRLEAAAMIRYGIQLCDLLRYLHGLETGPIIFRDVKPSNIMIDAGDHVRLIDFGIARKATPGRASDTVPLGTIGFAAPELLETGRSDSRSDLYSLGATFYYVLSGGRSYQAERKPLELGGGLTERMLAALVDKLLDDRPERRPASAEEARTALERCLEAGRPGSGAGGGTRPSAGSGVPPVPSGRLRIAVGGLYAGAGATFTALSIAALLDDAGIAHAVAEHPRARPELFGLLDGDRRAPDGCGRTAAGEALRWIDGLAEWIPVIPGVVADDLRAGFAKRLLRIDAAVTIVDAGDWGTGPVEDVEELVDVADIVVAVADPQPSRWASPSTRKAAEALMKRKDAGRRVEFIANKAVPFPGAKEWLASFPAKPAAVIPHVPYETIVSSAWEGRLVQRDPETIALLRKSLGAWLERTTERHRIASEGRREGWFGKLFFART